MSLAGELKSIHKSYGAVRANRGVDLAIRAGTIHALVGENGAGKSTAMKILFGLEKPDAGEVRILDQPVEIDRWSPVEAFQRGIGMVHQHFMLAGPESVLDNVVLGVEKRGFLGMRRRGEERRLLERLMSETGLEVPLDRPVQDLAIGLQSRCEILKVLYRDARFLILDEPTAVLTPQEIDQFLATLRRLRDQGKTILIVTHKLREVMAIADEITVLRAGAAVATRAASQTTTDELSELMVGRKLQLPRAKPGTTSDNAPFVEVDSGSATVRVHKGEIVGVAGVEGNGQQELMDAVYRSESAKKSRLVLFGEDLSHEKQSRFRKRSLALIPADRHGEGLALDLSLRENLRLGRPQALKSIAYRKPTSKEAELLREHDVRPSDNLELPARALSGGNQQKLIVARELGNLTRNAPSFMMAAHPTRGVDVGAIEQIHTRVLDEAMRGTAVLLISSELEELMALSHRIVVLFRGRIVDELHGPVYDEKRIGRGMLTGQGNPR